MRFLPLHEAERERQQWHDLAYGPDGMNAHFEVGAKPRHAAQAVYYHTGWWPFAGDDAGNFLALDGAPGPAGAVGQILSFGADEPVVRVIAPSVDAFLVWCAEACAGAVAEADGSRIRLPEAEHLLDALRLRDAA
jgi:cell wall assembly regulator SMI1